MSNPLTAGLAPTHPGELLREIVLPALPVSKTEVARLLGLSRQHLHDILAERKPVTPRTALRLAKLLGGSPESWLRMQMAFDLRCETAAMADELERIAPLAA